MNLRTFLLKSGVSARDLAEAVADARTTARSLGKWAGMAETVLLKVAAKPKLGNRTRAVVVLGAHAASLVRTTADDMLAEKKRR